MSCRRQPFVIVGGGPSGLLMSNLLSRYGVPSLLYEQQSTASRFRHPQAHFMNTRTMELLKYYTPPVVFSDIQAAMSPVEQWKSFRFVHSMSDEVPLAHVVHPVDRPLQVDLDANGVLLEDSMTLSSSFDLSPCTVGHLAQHSFCRILHQAAVENATTGTELHYGTRVENVHRISKDDNRMQVQLANGDFLMTPLVIAADGAHSPLRQAQGIRFAGQSGIQHLMNIHVTLSVEQAQRLHEKNNFAMLYSIFSQHVVAMVVCHSLGDYIVQVPFFPPYQTVEDDFNEQRLHTIIGAIFGPKVSEWTVQSAKPWTMSALVAERYNGDGVALVGDAAHVFPPAGGFGMNTGLQDVHNLAWRLANLYQTDRLEDLPRVLKKYSEERRAIAQENAALSVRNYKRLLEVTKACYLNEQHPTLLVKGLDVSPLPLQAKCKVFQSLFHAALLPLSWLDRPDSFYSKHIRTNLRKVLKSGTGLPLLFPRFELGFGYDLSDSKSKSGSDWRNDTVADKPTLQVGKLVPHVELEVMKAGGNDDCLQLQFLRPGVISSTNLSAQLERGHRPTFVLLSVGGKGTGDDVSLARQQLGEATGSPVAVVHVVKDVQDVATNDLVVRQLPLAFELPPGLVLIRPDGHVASIVDDCRSPSLERMMEDVSKIV